MFIYLHAHGINLFQSFSVTNFALLCSGKKEHMDDKNLQNLARNSLLILILTLYLIEWTNFRWICTNKISICMIILDGSLLDKFDHFLWIIGLHLMTIFTYYLEVTSSKVG